MGGYSGKFAADVGAEHQVAVSGGQAIEIIDNWQPDALILDMLLAGETAIALLNELAIVRGFWRVCRLWFVRISTLKWMICVRLA